MKLYIGDSNQPGIEHELTNMIADALIPKLQRQPTFVIGRARDDMDVYAIIADSNSWGAEIHTGIHTNGFNGSARGIEIFIDHPGGEGDRLAQCLYNELMKIYPGPGRGIKVNPSFIEVHNTNAPAALVELGFGDNADDVAWLRNNLDLITETLTKGYCVFAGVNYVAPNQTAPKPAINPEIATLKAQLSTTTAEKDKLSDALLVANAQLADVQKQLNAAQDELVAYRALTQAWKRAMKI